jgi:hypothetical protein
VEINRRNWKNSRRKVKPYLSHKLLTVEFFLFLTMASFGGSEKARLLAEGNAAREARRAEAEAEAKRQRDLDREKSRQALQEASENHITDRKKSPLFY